MKARLGPIALLAGLLSTPAVAQDPQLSQFYASPMYLNPALTGNTYQDRLQLNYRLQWAGIPPGFETYAVGWDHRAAQVNSGVGVMVMHDRAGSNGLSFTQASAAYSYEARIDRKRAMRGGLRLGYTQRSYDPDNFLFADQVIRDNASTSLESGLIERVSYFDVSAGGLYFTEAFWAGFSVNHLNRPDQSLQSDGEARLPMRTSVHLGHRIPLDGLSVGRSRTELTLAAHYKAQGKWDQLDVGGYLHLEQVSFGLWYRGLPGIKAYAPGYPNDDAVILMAGFETDRQWTFIYCYDITVSWLARSSGGAHELSVRYEWPRRTKNRKAKIVPCPKF
ncbi:MAG: type IX secretion system membrane protein PorP/SprF [Flavobacteriales bacterium]|nr:type IX secretion system membrane protein PorP/SprF [Flavobacteriales bacterium]MCB0788896.1 type IX secretion system membrane protein PorP/SprF [Flavobacteriales bacterium]MCB0809795.1 type IX secretion system membrane protein PorP/SprF [Flavobacteriales bacterium]HPJ51770.1 type IX secretion system membrane protein PorP/SprF [Flavobacteriales bacterium]